MKYLPSLIFVLTATVSTSVMAKYTVRDRDSKPAIERQVAKHEPADAITLDQLLKPPVAPEDAIEPLRRTMLHDAAYMIGFRGGWQNKSVTLEKILEEHSDVLDTFFQFATLINQDGVLPPVITEAQDASSISDDQIRTAGRIYTIVRDERFVSVPPTWRDYLYAGFATDAHAEVEKSGVYPKEEAEKALWNESIRTGWEEGQKEALHILDQNFNRVVRDYVGMLNYQTLIQKNMVAAPVVDTAYETLDADPDAKKIKVDNTLKVITQGVSFNHETGEWLPTIADSVPEDLWGSN